VVGTSPLTLLITADGPDGGPDAALLLGLNPSDATVTLRLPAEQPLRWVRYLDSASPGPFQAEGERLEPAEATLEVAARSVVLLGLPAEPG
jgi:hypothetical protein